MEILPVIQLLLLMLSKCLFFENWIGTFIHWIMKMNNFKIKQTIISGKILRKDTMIGTKNCKKTILELSSRHLIVYLMFLNCFIKTMIQNLSKITFFFRQSPPPLRWRTTRPGLSGWPTTPAASATAPSGRPTSAQASGSDPGFSLQVKNQFKTIRFS